jgi:dTMP kinase
VRGKLIVIEGTDCSGKETQANLLIEKIRKTGILVEKFSFPNYESPTGKIIGGPYLGK